MKASRKKKTTPKESGSQVPKADIGTHVVGLLEGPWGSLFIVAATFLLGIWTFDAKLSLSGDNAEFITLARSMAQGEGLSHINSPDPKPATKYPFGFPLLLAPLAWTFPGEWVPMKVWVLVLFALGMGVLYQVAKERVGVLPGLAVVVLSVVLGKSYLTHGPTGRSLRPAAATLRTPSHVRSALSDLFAIGAVARRTGRRARGSQGKLVARRRVRLHHLGVLHPHSWNRAHGGPWWSICCFGAISGDVCSLAARRLSAGCRGPCATKR